MNHIALTLAQTQFFSEDKKPAAEEEVVATQENATSPQNSVSFSHLFNEESESHAPHAVASPTSSTHSTHASDENVASFFELSADEPILHAYSCALIRSVLFPGRLYLTKKNFCFASNLHRKGALIEGYLTKPRKVYNTRMWVVLNIEGLSYYKDSQSTYTPLKRVGIHDIVGVEKGDKTKLLIFCARRRPLTLVADSVQQQEEWFETLEFTLYSFKHGHKYEKLKIPVETVFSIEPNPVFVFPNAVTISTFDTQYFFALFSNTQDVLQSLTSIWSSVLPKEHVLSDTDDSGDEELLPNDIPYSPPNQSPIVHFPAPAAAKEDSPLLKHENEPIPASTPTPSIPHPTYVSESSFTATDSSSITPSSSTEISPPSESAQIVSPPSHASQSTTSPPPASEVVSPPSSSQSVTSPPPSSDRTQVVSPPPSSSQPATSPPPTTEPAQPVSSPSHAATLVHSFSRTISRTINRALHYSPGIHSSSSTPASPPQSSSGSPALTSLSPSPPTSPTGSPHASGVDEQRRVRRDASKNDEWRRIFNITDDDKLLREYLCGYTGLGGFRGRLFLSYKRVCYYHKAPLGSTKTKVSVLFTDIVSIWEGTKSSYVPHAITISTKDGVEHCFHSFISRARVFHRLHKLWDEAHELNSPNDANEALRQFNLPAGEEIIKSFSCSLNKSYFFIKGRLYITSNFICFKSSPFTLDRRVVIPLSAVDLVEKEKFGFVFSAVRVTTTDQQSFLFSMVYKAEGLYETLQAQAEVSRTTNTGGETEAKAVKIEGDGVAEEEQPITSVLPGSEPPSEVFKDIKMALTTLGNGAGVKPMKVTILTIGSRGDVQPFIALGKGLQAAGHSVVLATHEEFRGFVTEHGLEFKVLGGNPRELMQLVVNNGIFTVKFMKIALQTFRGFVEQLLHDSWEACQGTDAIIEAPSAMAGIHVAERLGVPYFNAFTMPWTRTYSFPNPFAVPERPLGRGYNYFSYYMVEQMFWQPIRDMVNHFREKIGLETFAVGSGGHALHIDVPYLYCFSKHLVPKPPDWADWITLCGFWFLDSPLNYVPPKDLQDFIEAGPPPIYIGFGSIVVSDPDELTKIILEAIELTGQRAILAKGWADMGVNEVPPSVFQLQQAPHDWLFPKMSLVCHHGGAGTTAAGLRFGKPTVIVPFFGDQFFWGQRVREIGVGDTVPHKSLTAQKLSKAILQCLKDPQIGKKAKLMGEHIRSEDGVWTAVNAFHKYMDKARLTQRLAKEKEVKEVKETKEAKPQDSPVTNKSM